jgi:hypothetical protein
MRSSPVMERSQPAEAFTSVLLGDGHDLDRAAVGGGVELDLFVVDRPALARAS